MNTKPEQQDFFCPRVWVPYWSWEDWKNGIFTNHIRQEMIEMSKELLSNARLFSKVIDRVISEWPMACIHNLSNKSRNRKAFLGQAACLINHGANEIETVNGWWMLDHIQQREANETALKKIREYAENLYRSERP